MPAGLPATTIALTTEAGVTESDCRVCLQGWDRKVAYLIQKSPRKEKHSGRQIFFSNVSVTELVFFFFFVFCHLIRDL